MGVTLGLRQVGIGVQNLLDLGVREVILSGSSPARLRAVEGRGLEIIERRPIPHEEGA